MGASEDWLERIGFAAISKQKKSVKPCVKTIEKNKNRPIRTFRGFSWEILLVTISTFQGVHVGAGASDTTVLDHISKSRCEGLAADDQPRALNDGVAGRHLLENQT
jgi:hypothetical protein